MYKLVPFNWGGAAIQRAVHGTLMSSIWAIISDDCLEPSVQNVLHRNGKPLIGVYAHEEHNANKCAFYAAWQAPWGDVDVYGRAFLFIEGESAFVVKPSKSDQLVFQKQPRVTNVVFQLASRNKLGLGEKYERRWDKARERPPRLQKEWSDDDGVNWALDEQYMPDGPSDSGPHGHLPEPQRSVSPAPSQESSDDDSDAMNLKKHPRFGDLLRFRVLLCQVGLTSVPVYARSDLESYQIDCLRCGEEFFGYFMHDPHWVRMGRIGCCPVEVNGQGIVEVADALDDVDVVWVAADVRIRSAILNPMRADQMSGTRRHRKRRAGDQPSRSGARRRKVAASDL
jgi:hypothetical protein